MLGSLFLFECQHALLYNIAAFMHLLLGNNQGRSKAYYISMRRLCQKPGSGKIHTQVPCGIALWRIVYHNGIQ